jgi:hypothetical protein
MSPVLASTKCIVPAGEAVRRVSMSLMARDEELPPQGDTGAPPEPKYSVGWGGAGGRAAVLFGVRLGFS